MQTFNIENQAFYSIFSMENDPCTVVRTYVVVLRWSVSDILSKVKKKCIKKILFWIESFYPANMNFIIRHSFFPQSYYSGFKVIIPDPELILRIQSFCSGSKVSYSGSKVITPETKIQSNLIFRYWSMNT